MHTYDAHVHRTCFCIAKDCAQMDIHIIHTYTCREDRHKKYTRRYSSRERTPFGLLKAMLEPCIQCNGMKTTM